MGAGQEFRWPRRGPVIALFVVCLLFPFPSGALTIMWESSIGGAGDEGLAWLAPLPDGEFLLVGNTSTDARGGSDVLLTRTDRDGRLVQTARLGTGPAREVPKTGALVPGGGAVVLGISHPVSGGPTLHLLRVNSGFELLWERTYPASKGPDDAYGVAVLADGGFLVLAGQPAVTGRSLVLLRLEPDGSERWRHTLVSRPGLARAGVLARLSAGGFVVAGADDRAIQHDLDLFIVRLDNEGRTLWERSFPEDGEDIVPVTASESPDRTVVVAGIEEGQPGSRIVAIAVDPFGRAAWHWRGWPADGAGDVGSVVFSGRTCLVVGSSPVSGGRDKATHLAIGEIGEDGVEQSRYSTSPVDGVERGRVAVVRDGIMVLGIEARSAWTRGTDVLLRAVSFASEPVPTSTIPSLTPSAVLPTGSWTTADPGSMPSSTERVAFSVLTPIGAVLLLLVFCGRR